MLSFFLFLLFSHRIFAPFPLSSSLILLCVIRQMKGSTDTIRLHLLCSLALLVGQEHHWLVLLQASFFILIWVAYFLVPGISGRFFLSHSLPAVKTYMRRCFFTLQPCPRVGYSPSTCLLPRKVYEISCADLQYPFIGPCVRQRGLSPSASYSRPISTPSTAGSTLHGLISTQGSPGQIRLLLNNILYWVRRTYQARESGSKKRGARQEQRLWAQPLTRGMPLSSINSVRLRSDSSGRSLTRTVSMIA